MSSLTKEERLLLKQLAVAAGELIIPPTNEEEIENRGAAQQYFFVDDYSKNIHSFLNICNHFGINPLSMRKTLIQIQLGEATQTDFDNMFKREIEVAKENEIEPKTMDEMISEEIESLKELIVRRLHGKFRKDKKEERGSPATEGKGIQVQN